MQPLEPANIPYILLGQMDYDPPLKGLSGDAPASEDKGVMQDMTTVYITTMYYSAQSNLYYQSVLPSEFAKVDEENPRLKVGVERSYADFTSAADWLTKNGGEFISTSPAKQYYDEVTGMEEGSVKNIANFYSR